MSAGRLGRRLPGILDLCETWMGPPKPLWAKCCDCPGSRLDPAVGTGLNLKLKRRKLPSPGTSPRLLCPLGLTCALYMVAARSREGK